MKCRVEKSELSGKIACPPSKSYTHRAIFLASLAGNSTVRNPLLSEDTQATISACKKFGAGIDIKNGDITVRDHIKPNGEGLEIDAGNSGTTMRIAMGITSLFSNEIMLKGDSSLNKRPMGHLIKALNEMGGKCKGNNDEYPPITTKGPIKGGKIEIQGNESSQFITSLLICAPLTEQGIDITIKGKIVSWPYINATIDTMKEFKINVDIVKPYERYIVKSGRYKNATFNVPSDASSLALLLSAAVLAGKNLEIIGNLGELPQADKRFMNILEKMGVTVPATDGKIFVNSSWLTGGEFDLSDAPDLLPPLAILILRSRGRIRIKNVGHARKKETDRVAILASELKKLGIGVNEICENTDELVLEPVNKHTGNNLDPRGDHRLFMAFCIAGMYVGNCTVNDPDSAAISYPDFVDEMKRLGGKISLAE